MAKLDIRDDIDFHIDVVYPAFRDRLKETAPYLPNIEEIVVEKYERIDDNTVEVVNLWKASEGEVPKVAQSFIKPDMLQWTDYATWHDDELYCEWNMEVGFLSEAVKCSGQTRYKAEGEAVKKSQRENRKRNPVQPLPGFIAHTPNATQECRACDEQQQE